MNIEQQALFLISALGGMNGLTLGSYLLFRKKESQLADYFLSALLVMVSIRVIKSAFLYFNVHLFAFFIKFGLAACLLIGPFLYLYVKSMLRPNNQLKQYWGWHVVPYLVLFGLFSGFSSYYDNRQLWGWVVEGIYKQWMIYVFATAFLLQPVFIKLWKRQEKLSEKEIWLLNIFWGIFLVWLAYDTSNYTSYIVGGLSFTFLLYLSLLVWGFKQPERMEAGEEAARYANSSLQEADALRYMEQIETHMAEAKPYLDPELSISKLSDHLGISAKDLSQVINQVTGVNYSTYIADLRVAEARQLLRDPAYRHYKIAAIAYESGFNSLSSFNAHFKRSVGITAKQYRKQHQ